MRAVDDRADRHDIADVLIRYATAIDRRDWRLFESCFTADCHLDYEGAGVWDGVGVVTRFMADAHASMGHTLHRLANIAVALDGDAAQARCYVDAVLMSEDGRTGINAVGWYDDELARTTDGWRIARRHYTMVRLAALGSEGDLSGG